MNQLQAVAATSAIAPMPRISAEIVWFFAYKRLEFLMLMPPEA